MLRQKLDPDALMDEPDVLQLDPLLLDCTDALRAEMLDRGDPPEMVALC